MIYIANGTNVVINHSDTNMSLTKLLWKPICKSIMVDGIAL